MNNRIGMIKYSIDKHSCLLYHSTDDLFDILGPYFKEGLENNNFCAWILPESMRIEEAESALGKTIKDLNHYIAIKQIEIIDCKNFYLKSGTFNALDVLRYWAQKENQILEKGFDGIRVCGDGTWGLKEEYWASFRTYEQEVDTILKRSKQRMTAVCTYCVNHLELQQLLDIGTFHKTTLCKKTGQWDNLSPYDFDIVTN